MSTPSGPVNSLDRDKLIDFLLDAFHRTLIHYGMWFKEAEYQLGLDGAVAADEQAFKTSLAVQMKRLAKLLDFEVDDAGIPLRLKQLDRQQLLALARAQSINWLANDGIWFQAIEKNQGMDSAKRLNDTCWTHFSPYEAERIKMLAGLGDNSGLEGLRTALGYRTYALINQQSIHDVDNDSFVFQMNDCRVQSARKFRGLSDYPCKSAGMVEYPYFAKAIDSRITTECLGCPPDDHPDDWYCAWKFTLEDC